MLIVTMLAIIITFVDNIYSGIVAPKDLCEVLTLFRTGLPWISLCSLPSSLFVTMEPTFVTDIKLKPHEEEGIDIVKGNKDNIKG